MSDKIDKIIEILKELHKEGAEVLENNKGIFIQTYPEEIVQNDPYKTLEYLSLASFLARKVNDSKKSEE